jgi:hypothetical protein
MPASGLRSMVAQISSSAAKHTFSPRTTLLCSVGLAANHSGKGTEALSINYQRKELRQKMTMLSLFSSGVEAKIGQMLQ